MLKADQRVGGHMVFSIQAPHINTTNAVMLGVGHFPSSLENNEVIYIVGWSIAQGHHLL